MSRSVTSIKNEKKKKDISVILLSAGLGHRMKSIEPRCLIKIGEKYLIEHQVESLNHAMNGVEIIGVFGPHVERILKKVNNIRFVENQLYNETNNSESLRLGINNAANKNILFIHGDIFFRHDVFKGVDFSHSFLILDGSNDLEDKEVGVTTHNDKIITLSYGLEKKWAQICYLTGKELKLLKTIFFKQGKIDKKKLSFELINQIIENGGIFRHYENNKTNIVEIDCIKDIKNENLNL